MHLLMGIWAASTLWTIVNNAINYFLSWIYFNYSVKLCYQQGVIIGVSVFNRPSIYFAWSLQLLSEEGRAGRVTPFYR